ncbi:16S rRNA (cytidine(1402)-2'-O)-methyltransferase [Acholeplasma sp. OttesenSCG-928-E16]|nr:16S rRNA (cytidine(1402)-2'-O)-methyltransferase [Acholeplasma sp. OttesenSCG-928-E16]
MNLEQISFSNEKASIYIVSTPIGNLKDITFRAIETLKQVDFILAEDTRTSAKLLRHYDIKTTMISYHEFNKNEKEKMIINYLEEGLNLALISDAGTPGISDPGYEIINKAIEKGFNIIPIPGASAILASLVASGIIIQPFTFIGFLPKKKQELETTLLDYKYRKETLVIYESPLRIKETINDIYKIFGNRKIALLRELTKLHESIIRGDLEEIINLELMEKGEYVLIIEGIDEKSIFDKYTILELYNQYIKDGMEEKDAMKLVSKKKGIKKSDIYKEIKIK